MESQHNKVIVVDENDEIIGVEFMTDAIEKGLIRRGARICVFNESGEFLVQQRSKNVFEPLLYDLSAAGHVDEGETYEAAAYRELNEELGLRGYSLILVETSFRTKGFYNAIYKVIVPDDTQIDCDPEEVETVLWYRLDTLDKEIKTNPENFTLAFNEVWSLLRDKILYT